MEEKPAWISRIRILVGAFYMPKRKLVYINVNTLKTLPERQFHSGMGEVIKHGLIKDRAYYQWIKDNQREIARRNPDMLAYLVEGSCRIKRSVVEEDPENRGLAPF